MPQRNVILLGHVIVTHNAVHMAHCASQCLRHCNCSSFNLRMLAENLYKYEIIDFSKAAKKLQHTEGWIYITTKLTHSCNKIILQVCEFNDSKELLAKYVIHIFNQQNTHQCLSNFSSNSRINLLEPLISQFCSLDEGKLMYVIIFDFEQNFCLNSSSNKTLTSKSVLL